MEKKEPKIKILVACHKADPAIRQDDIYMPIHVGKALHPELDLGFQGDDTGDNISEKNGSYCELTAMYWAWKNLPKDVDIVGLCHYRRYFDLNKRDPQVHIYKLLNRCDAVILPYNNREKTNIDVLIELTCQEDAAIFIDLLVEKFPHWKMYIGKYFYQKHKASWCNMFIMHRIMFDKYCEFLFPILADLEVALLPTPYYRIQRRIGYFAEMLLGFWLHVNRYKYRTVRFEGYTGTFIRISRTVRNAIAFNMYRHKPYRVYYAAKIGLNQNGIILKHTQPDATI